ncbi:hypothetical protein AWB64_01944 [Caballeronia sordidicola]|uniref:Uncharacterized protein n=2 Tax=Burkholderiaceae TaxID=119060 RepID=A0A158FXT4_CABSO|nr:hypothetical protein AWB64_01944 [Caballeronia sordidicola]
MRPVLSALSSTVALALVAGSMSLGSAGAAAAERYIEVWNPPESQLHATKNKTRPVVSAQAKKKRKSGPAVKQVADRTTAPAPALTVAPSAGGSSAGRAKAAPKSPDSLPKLPPLIGPDGRVLRV